MTTATLDLSALEADEELMTGLAGQFAEICLRNPSHHQKQIEAARQVGWTDATTRSLDDNSLRALKKDVLEIPGGGGRLRETQQLLVRETENTTMHLAVETQLVEGRLAEHTCAIYARGDEFLKTCAQMGRIINRPPDRNVNYRSSGSHFISWILSIAAQRSKISCQSTPGSAILPFEGTALLLVIDHITKSSGPPRAPRQGQHEDGGNR